MHHVARVVTALLLAAVAAGTQAPPELRRIAVIPFAEPKATAVAVSPAGTRAAWLDAAGVLHGLEVVRPARSAVAIPDANATALAFVDEEHLDVFHERDAARRLHLPTGAWTLPSDARRPTPLDPAAYRRTHHEFLHEGRRTVVEVAASTDDDVSLARWSSGHVTLCNGRQEHLVTDRDCFDVAISQDGAWVAARRNHSLLFVEVATGARHELPEPFDGPGRRLASADAGPHFLLADAEAIQRYDPVRRRVVQRVPLPPEFARTTLYQLAGGPHQVVAVRAYHQLEPRVGLLDLHTERWRTYRMPHGSMQWSHDGATLLVGSGGPTHHCEQPDRVWLVPRDHGEPIEPGPGAFGANDVRTVVTPGYHAVVPLADGSFAGTASDARAYRHFGDEVQPLPGRIWEPTVALDAHWLLTTWDGVWLHGLDTAERRPVLEEQEPVTALAVARAPGRCVVAGRETLHVFEWRAAPVGTRR